MCQHDRKSIARATLCRNVVPIVRDKFPLQNAFFVFGIRPLLETTFKLEIFLSFGDVLVEFNEELIKRQLMFNENYKLRIKTFLIGSFPEISTFQRSL